MSAIPLPLDPAGLSPAQVQVAAALATGATITSAAESAGLHRSTVHNWLHDSPTFAAAVETAREDFAASIRDRLRDLSALAIQTLEDVMRNPEASASARIKAALAVLNRPTYPKGAWNLPEPTDLKREQEFMRDSALIRMDYRNMIAQEAFDRAILREERERERQQLLDEQAAKPPAPVQPIRHNSTLLDAPAKIPPRPAQAVSQKVGRNVPCPCGSGQKYKRCCGKTAQMG